MVQSLARINILPILFIASVFGLIGGILWLKLNKLNHQDAFPFGPYICILVSSMLSDIVFKTFYINNFLLSNSL
jgi:leader peptidase (prepilin peptidase)/N-methyltransferase